MTRPPWFPGMVVVATHNPAKLEEWRTLLGALDVELRTTAALGVPEPEETETTYRGNARLKAVHAARLTGLPALADDTGFEVDALGGGPGVQTARWADAHGGYPNALDALLSQAEPGSEVRLVCAVALARDSEVREAEGIVRGRLRDCASSAPGFAALLDPTDAQPLLVDGVLAHRRAAFRRLTSR